MAEVEGAEERGRGRGYEEEEGEGQGEVCVGKGRRESGVKG